MALPPPPPTNTRGNAPYLTHNKQPKNSNPHHPGPKNPLGGEEAAQSTDEGAKRTAAAPPPPPAAAVPLPMPTAQGGTRHETTTQNPPCREAMGRGTARAASGGGAMATPQQWRKGSWANQSRSNPKPPSPPPSKSTAPQILPVAKGHGEVAVRRTDGGAIALPSRPLHPLLRKRSPSPCLRHRKEPNTKRPPISSLSRSDGEGDGSRSEGWRGTYDSGLRSLVEEPRDIFQCRGIDELSVEQAIYDGSNHTAHYGAAP